MKSVNGLEEQLNQSRKCIVMFNSFKKVKKDFLEWKLGNTLYIQPAICSVILLIEVGANGIVWTQSTFKKHMFYLKLLFLQLWKWKTKDLL